VFWLNQTTHLPYQFQFVFVSGMGFQQTQTQTKRFMIHCPQYLPELATSVTVIRHQAASTDIQATQNPQRSPS